MINRSLPSSLILRNSDVSAARLNWRDVEQGIAAGEVERIAPGTLIRTGLVDDDTASLAAIALRKPNATICLLSALDRHDLTDVIPSSVDIAIPRGSRPLTAPYSKISWHHFDTETFNVGRDEISLIEGISIGLYSAERTIVDAFRLSYLLGADVANEALKRWLRVPGSQPAALLKIADYFPKALPRLRTALEILL